MCVAEMRSGSVVGDTTSRHSSTSPTPSNNCIAVLEVFTAEAALHDGYNLHADCLGGSSPFASAPLLIT